ncbi:hypothetical protein J6590_048186, partial [Homalodisca vitripennis]
ALVFLDSTSDFINRRPQAKTLLLELASLHDVSKQKLFVPCRIGCISRPPAGHAQRRVFVSRRQTLQRSHRSSG